MSYSSGMSSLYDQAVNAADQYGVPPNLMTSMIAGESGWNTNAYNTTSGAMGLAQVLPSTAANPGYGVTPLTQPYNATSSINFMAQYLSGLYNKLGSWAGAVGSYSGTPAGSVPYTGNNQQGNILSAISAADSGGGSYLNALMGGGNGSSSSNPAFGGGPLNPTPTAATTAVTNAAASVLGNIIPDISAWLKQGGIILLGVVVIGAGVFMLGKAQFK